MGKVSDCDSENTGSNPVIRLHRLLMKKKQKISVLSVPTDCQVTLKKNSYIFSGFLGKTRIDAFQCDAVGNRFRIFKKMEMQSTFVESYTSHPSPFYSCTRQKNKEGDAQSLSYTSQKNPFENAMPMEKKRILFRHGSLRPFLAKMNGAVYGYALFLKLVGLGYKFSLYPSQKKTDWSLLSIKVGHSHKFKFFIPKSVGIFLYPRNILAIFSSEKEILENLAYHIRSVRPPTPYKGKGIRFLNEVVLLKEGKKTK